MLVFKELFSDYSIPSIFEIKKYFNTWPEYITSLKFLYAQYQHVLLSLQLELFSKNLLKILEPEFQLQFQDSQKKNFLEFLKNFMDVYSEKYPITQSIILNDNSNLFEINYDFFEIVKILYQACIMLLTSNFLVIKIINKLFTFFIFFFDMCFYGNFCFIFIFIFFFFLIINPNICSLQNIANPELYQKANLYQKIIFTFISYFLIRFFFFCTPVEQSLLLHFVFESSETTIFQTKNWNLLFFFLPYGYYCFLIYCYMRNLICKFMIIKKTFNFKQLYFQHFKIYKFFFFDKTTFSCSFKFFFQLKLKKLKKNYTISLLKEPKTFIFSLPTFLKIKTCYWIPFFDYNYYTKKISFFWFPIILPFEKDLLIPLPLFLQDKKFQKTTQFLLCTIQPEYNYQFFLLITLDRFIKISLFCFFVFLLKYKIFPLFLFSFFAKIFNRISFQYIFRDRFSNLNFEWEWDDYLERTQNEPGFGYPFENLIHFENNFLNNLRWDQATDFEDFTFSLDELIQSQSDVNKEDDGDENEDIDFENSLVFKNEQIDEIKNIEDVFTKEKPKIIMEKINSNFYVEDEDDLELEELENKNYEEYFNDIYKLSDEFIKKNQLNLNKIVTKKSNLENKSVNNKDDSILKNELNNNINFDEIESNSDNINFDEIESNSDNINFDEIESNSDNINFDEIESNSDNINFDEIESNSDNINFDEIESNSDNINFDEQNMDTDIQLSDFDLPKEIPTSIFNRIYDYFFKKKYLNVNIVDEDPAFPDWVYKYLYGESYYLRRGYVRQWQQYINAMDKYTQSPAFEESINVTDLLKSEIQWYQKTTDYFLWQIVDGLTWYNNLPAEKTIGILEDVYTPILKPYMENKNFSYENNISDYIDESFQAEINEELKFLYNQKSEFDNLNYILDFFDQERLDKDIKKYALEFPDRFEGVFLVEKPLDAKIEVMKSELQKEMQQSFDWFFDFSDYLYSFSDLINNYYLINLSIFIKNWVNLFNNLSFIENLLDIFVLYSHSFYNLGVECFLFIFIYFIDNLITIPIIIFFISFFKFRHKFSFVTYYFLRNNIWYRRLKDQWTFGTQTIFLKDDTIEVDPVDYILWLWNQDYKQILLTVPHMALDLYNPEKNYNRLVRYFNYLQQLKQKLIKLKKKIKKKNKKKKV